MTQDEIIRMAREAGFVIYDNERRSVEGEAENFERFADLVAAHEREACAKVCDHMADMNKKLSDSARPEHCAAAIRARSYCEE